MRLADGSEWILRHPSYRPTGSSLTDPDIDGPLDRLYDSIVIEQQASLIDVWEIARRLIEPNYDLEAPEIEQLLEVAEGPECQSFVESILGVLFGRRDRERSYTEWIRASMMSNGIDVIQTSGDRLSEVMGVLVSTGRTIPAGKFIEAHAVASDLAALESLV
ncbi:MAG: hypothetical protein SFX72_19650 [Isosphaeraceae bacterium]|nr:hypothetical protein [Isosphaeraceae bacterium]